MGHRNHNRGSGRHPAPLPPSRLVVLSRDTADNLDFLRAVLGLQVGHEVSRETMIDSIVQAAADVGAQCHTPRATG